MTKTTTTESNAEIRPRWTLKTITSTTTTTTLTKGQRLWTPAELQLKPPLRQPSWWLPPGEGVSRRSPKNCPACLPELTGCPPRWPLPQSAPRRLSTKILQSQLLQTSPMNPSTPHYICTTTRKTTTDPSRDPRNSSSVDSATGTSPSHTTCSYTSAPTQTNGRTRVIFVKKLSGDRTISGITGKYLIVFYFLNIIHILVYVQQFYGVKFIYFSYETCSERDYSYGYAAIYLFDYCYDRRYSFIIISVC